MAQKIIIEQDLKDKKDKPIIVIYFDEEKTNFQRIKTGDQFKGDYMGVIEHITNSDKKRDIKNYHSFELV